MNFYAIYFLSREAAIAILKTTEWREALKNECYEYIPKKKRTTPFRQMIERMPGKAAIKYRNVMKTRSV